MTRSARGDLGVTLRRRRTGTPGPVEVRAAGVELLPGALSRLFEAPRWLRSLGRTSWLVVGLAAILVGVVWILGITASIVEPVVAGGVVAAVCSPGVAWLARHRVPRAAGAGLMLLALVAIAVGVFLLVIGGIVEQSSQIEASANQALDTIEGWANDADANGTSDTSQDVKIAVTGVGSTLLQGVAGGIQGLTSVAFFLSFTLFSLFFLLKDGPTIKRFVDRHLGVPVPVARIVTGQVLGSLRRYFVGVTIVAAFNAVVVGLGALLLGVRWPGRSPWSPSSRRTSPSSAPSSRAPSRW